ncbi:TetR/AcrR family transcriptional regulator [Archangium violaceum]|uniref:TetR/AcrR family transcriptional regulator n=1 Tax=Archangium violaceum TaxID=83451 RepID=UPI0036D7B1ED
MPRINADTLAEHREETWSRLRESFLEAMQEVGYAALSLADVARRAGIARNTIYNYAPDKAALLLAVVKSAVEPFVASLVEESARESDPEERLALIVRRTVASFAPDAHGLPLLNAPDELLPNEVGTALGACFAPVLRVIEQLVEQGVGLGVFRPIADVRRAVDMMTGVMTSVRRAVVSGQPVDLIAAETTEFLLGALRQPARVAPRAPRAKR